jgi:hypothetical protein
MFECLSNRQDWPVRPLAAGIHINKESRFQIDDLEEYRILGVTNQGAGVVVKRTVCGSDLTMREYQRASANQLMWCKVDTKNGAFGVTKEEHVGSLASPNMCLADIDTAVIEPRLLQFFFQLPAVIDGITAASLGTTNRQYLKPQEFLDSVRLRLPSLWEQRRVVPQIEELAAQIHEARSLRQQADERTRSLLQSRITEVISRHMESHSWKAATLPEFAAPNHNAIKRGPFGSHLRKEFFVPNGYKVYEQKHAIHGDFEAGDYYIDEAKFLEMKAFEVRPGDLIISCSGTIGKVAIVPDNAKPGIINQALLKITLDSSKMIRRFFKIVFESEYVAREVKKISPGSAMKNIGSVKILKRINFPLPTLADQQQFLDETDGLQAEVDALKRLQVETAAELDALLPAILDKAFKGEL